MNPTAEAATTAHTGNGSKSGSSMANEGKQNEGEKQEVLCVSIKKYVVRLILPDWHIKTQIPK
jgi:hypothetical protein